MEPETAITNIKFLGLTRFRVEHKAAVPQLKFNLFPQTDWFITLYLSSKTLAAFKIFFKLIKWQKYQKKTIKTDLNTIC